MHTDTLTRETHQGKRHQSAEEWKLEQGWDAFQLALIDHTGDDWSDAEPVIETKSPKVDADAVFAEEGKGWTGYVEWEKYPEKKKLGHEILVAHKFPPPPEFQLGPIPNTNPVLEGVRWKLWHTTVGGALKTIPDQSWKTVLEEKHPDMLHLLQFPYNGEAPKRLVTSKTITPTELHFVRNHGGIPTIDPADWELEIDGLVKNPQKFNLEQLKTLFPKITKTCTLQCSGTRRIEQIALYAGEGDEMINAPWAEGAISNAVYTGVSLKHVIKHCGGLVDGGKHLELFGIDTYFKQNEIFNYSVSVPWSKVKLNEVLLCWEMNGKPLPKIHGAPVRALVMGYIGARSTKWLYRIKALSRPTRAPVQSREYLYFNQQVGKHNQRPIDGINIQEMPVSSALMSPLNKQVIIHNGSIECKGWAYSGGGRWPERVELSADGGFSWYAVPPKNLSEKHRFAWRTWEFSLPVEVEGWIEIVVRCWDNSLNTQPLEVRSAWNWSLHVTSSCHRIKVYSVNKKRELTKQRLRQFREYNEPFVPITVPTDFPQMAWEDYDRFFEETQPRDVQSDYDDSEMEQD